ncbi:hypothetical protein RKD30_005457 [Streptomyces pristinaespiralis]
MPNTAVNHRAIAPKLRVMLEHESEGSGPRTSTTRRGLVGMDAMTHRTEGASDMPDDSLVLRHQPLRGGATATGVTY